MNGSKVLIENETLSAVVVLLLTLVVLYLIGSIAHPFLLGIGQAPGHAKQHAPAVELKTKAEAES